MTETHKVIIKEHESYVTRPANEFKIGHTFLVKNSNNQFVPTQIVNIEMIKPQMPGHGNAYFVVTPSGTVVVDNTLASNYAEEDIFSAMPGVIYKHFGSYTTNWLIRAYDYTAEFLFSKMNRKI